MGHLFHTFPFSFFFIVCDLEVDPSLDLGPPLDLEVYPSLLLVLPLDLEVDPSLVLVPSLDLFLVPSLDLKGLLRWDRVGK